MPLPETPRYFLWLDNTPPPPVVLELNKQKALEVFGVEGAKQIKLLDVDTAALLKEILSTIQGACGSEWMMDTKTPHYDCSLSPLGQNFGASWEKTPEFAMVRVLGMTPANADMTGTNMEDFQKLVDGNPQTFAFDFADVLAETMGIGRTDTVIPLDVLVSALQEYLMGTHPAINNVKGTMPVTMYDALNDMTPLAEKFGPVGQSPWTGPGEHPGVLVPDDASFTTKSNALLPNFKMRVVADSNLRLVAGIELAKGAGDMFIMDGTSPLHIDFMDPEKLEVEGISPQPTMDMRFSTKESPNFVKACTSGPECKNNLPPPVGQPIPGTLWSLKPFLLESLVVKAGWMRFGNRVYSKCYLVLNSDCLTGVDIGKAPDPPGWFVFTNNLQGISVPRPQYLWELLTEVAQLALHDPSGDGVADLAEGTVTPVFALRGVSIGFSGDELLEKMRPTLQAQADQIAQLLLGRYWTWNDSLDFYYRRAVPGGEAFLFFVAEADLVPDPENSSAPRPYAYDKPGFFSDRALSHKVSSKLIGGVDDTVHEKVRLALGSSTLYAQDNHHQVYKLQFYVPTGPEPVIVEVNAL